MSKKIISFLFIICFISGYSQVERSPDLLPINYFEAGEMVRYKIVYKFSEAWVGAGKVTFEIKERAVNGIPHLVLTAKGNTAPAFDLFYKVRDEYASVVHPKTLLPKFFLRRVNEGGFRIYNDLDFHHDSSYVYAEVEDSKRPMSSALYTIEKNTQDIVSAILYCRSLDYAKLDSGQTYKFPLFIDNEIHQVGVRYLGKKVITTDYGEFNCIILQPLLLTGRVFEEADQMRIYMSDDAQRIPIYIESPLKVGKIFAVIEKYQKRK